jgi:hypothetical protein
MEAFGYYRQAFDTLENFPWNIVLIPCATVEYMSSILVPALFPYLISSRSTKLNGTICLPSAGSGYGSIWLLQAFDTLENFPWNIVLIPGATVEYMSIILVSGQQPYLILSRSPEHDRTIRFPSAGSGYGSIWLLQAFDTLENFPWNIVLIPSAPVKYMSVILVSGQLS